MACVHRCNRPLPIHLHRGRLMVSRAVVSKPSRGTDTDMQTWVHHVAGACNTSQAPESSLAASCNRTTKPGLAERGMVRGGGARLMACSSVMGLAGLSACHFHPAFRSASPSTVRCAPGPAQRAPLTASNACVK